MTNPTLTFGKYRGTAINDLCDREYLHWLASTPTIPRHISDAAAHRMDAIVEEILEADRELLDSGILDY